ncbi:MAG: hypothetical protein M0R06_11660 [Sphaerochaeta sp.]|jgi:hypothetical protein|nr:hypothetical protein [Sphaerochaeta sp.]
MSKTVTVKTYSPAGVFLGVLLGAQVGDVSMSLDGGVGECVIGVPAPFGADGQAWAEGNRVELSVGDADTASDASPEPGAAVVVFSGTITRVLRETGSSGSRVTVGALGDQHLLGCDILRVGAQTTLYSKATDGLTVTSGDQSAADIGEMARAVLDAYLVANPTSRLHYLPGDVPDVGVSATYTFEAMSVRDALDALKGMAAGVHWFVDASGRVTFGPTGGGTAHALTFGRELTYARIERSLERTRNSWLVWDGKAAGTYVRFEDAASVAAVGRRMEVRSDYGLADADAVAALGARLLSERKDVDVRLTLEVADSSAANGYDIETLRPGDTVRLMGFDADVADWTFRDAMLVTSVTWRRGSATVTVDVSPFGLVSAASGLSKDVAGLETRGIPESYT